MFTWLLLAACESDPVYTVNGVVVELKSQTRVVVDHEAIEGFMDAMAMPFDVADPALLEGVAPGDKITGQYRTGEHPAFVSLTVTGHGPPPVIRPPPIPVRAGQVVPAFAITLSDGSVVKIGPEQTERIALTFVDTRCPRPDACPAMITRLQQVAEGVGKEPGVRLLAVTLDPAHDSAQVLGEFAASRGPITFGSVSELDDLAVRAGLAIVRPEGEGEIRHGLRLLAIDKGGVLMERYDDAAFPVERVVEQLKTGAPMGDPTKAGTVSAPW